MSSSRASFSGSHDNISFLFSVCQNSTISNIIYTSYTFINIFFFFPLYIFIVYTGFQQWRHQRGVSTRATLNHSDAFTYHMIAVDILSNLGSSVYLLGLYLKQETMMRSGFILSGCGLPGQTLLHCLSCLEHYLAVVHPITYMSLKQTGGVRIRNVTLGCVWLLSLGWIGVAIVHLPGYASIPTFFLLGMSCTLIMFLGFSVLYVLTQPRPREAGRDNNRVDQSKQRAVYIIAATLASLLLNFVTLSVVSSLFDMKTHVFGVEHWCILLESCIMMTLPSQLILPLLFLHRAGKLGCCRQSSESG